MNQVEQLKKLVRGCLFRHIITSYEKLSSDRPLALAAWGVSLEFSVFDETLVTDFIKKRAKTGPERVSRDGQYKKLLVNPAKVVSDANDSEICPKVQVHMK